MPYSASRGERNKLAEARTRNGSGLRLSKRSPADDITLGVCQCRRYVCWNKSCYLAVEIFQNLPDYPPDKLQSSSSCARLSLFASVGVDSYQNARYFDL